MANGVLSRTYEIPQQFVQPVQPEQQALPPQQVPQQGAQQSMFPTDNLADIENDTQQYLTIAGTLDSFAKDMAQQGIDIFSPDLSQPGGGLPFQTAQKLKAGLLYAATKLQNRQKERTAMLPYQAAGQVLQLPGAQQTSAYQPFQEQFVSTRLDPQVEQINQFLRQSFYTQADADRANQQAEQLRNYYKNLIQTDPGNRAYYERQIAGIGQATKRLPASVFSGGGSSSAKEALDRAKLIRQVKAGILTNDQTPINVLRQVPNVEHVEYVNTGDKVGIDIFYKGQPVPVFIDLRSPDGGEGEINALINRVTGQAKIPNEKVFEFNTKVEIPPSTAGAALDSLQSLSDIESIPADKLQPILGNLNNLAVQGRLLTPEGAPILSIDPLGEKWWNWGSGFDSGTPRGFTIKYMGGTKTKPIEKREDIKFKDNPNWLQQFINVNANYLAPAFGGGFQQPGTSPTNPTTQPPAPTPQIDPDI